MKLDIRAAIGGIALCCSLISPSVAAQLATLLQAEPKLQAGCNWVLAYDVRETAYGNNAFPETRARYWYAVVSDTVPAGSVLEIKGTYTDVRYSAFHVHDGNAGTLDAIADYEILPDEPTAIRFLGRTLLLPSSVLGGTYTAYVKLNVNPPATREQNTAYRKPPGLLDGKAKKRTLIAYRQYLEPEADKDHPQLPVLSLQSPGKAPIPLPHAADKAGCDQLEAGLKASKLITLPVGIIIPPYVPEGQPIFRKFANSGGALGLSVGYNPHNGFMATKGDRTYGDFLLVRVRVPGYTTQSPLLNFVIKNGQPAPQVRYWSLCQNGANNTKVYSCMSDKDVVIDSQGYATIAISTDIAQPHYLTAARGFSWMNWGPDQVSALLLRELLADPDFKESVDNAPTTSPETTRGFYMPLATYCSRATLQRLAAAGSAAVFQACQADPVKRSGGLLGLGGLL